MPHDVFNDLSNSLCILPNIFSYFSLERTRTQSNYLFEKFPFPSYKVRSTTLSNILLLTTTLYFDLEI